MDNCFRKILTLDNLRNRHVIMMNWCYMCKKSRVARDLVGIHFLFFWDRVGSAPTGGGVVGLLKKSVWKSS